MGAGSSVQYSEAHKRIEADLKKARVKEKRSQKLLLLGAGESGKSTFLKQLKILHAEGFPDSQREQHKLLIQVNLLQSIDSILNAMKDLDIVLENKELKSSAASVEFALQSIKKTQDGSSVFKPHLVSSIKQLWNDKGFQAAYKRRDEYQLIDSAKFFIENVDRIGAANYHPNSDDILRCRVKTTGVIEVEFTLKNVPFRVVDVGGQRSERRKWIQCFQDVNSIIFVASLSEYNQLLDEDHITNRMQESLNLFRWVANHKVFSATAMMLFLNKTDLLKEKIASTPLTIAFPNYTGGNSAELAMQYIMNQYEDQNKNPDRPMYSHFTCATDTNQVKAILDSTIDVILNKNLNQVAL